MRLINIHTLELEQFFEADVPPYAILSHRWKDVSEELIFKEVFKHHVDVNKKGYTKLIKAAKVAATYDVHYLWIDTCCIDKRSSAELSEAINSMFTWYSGAKICLAYLEDAENGAEWESTFRKSVWFTRSWTLQELLAPKELDFYDSEWTLIGSRKSHATVLMDITGIWVDILMQHRPIWKCTIAEKMAWAANRTATRLEDVAYSLLGIFDVNMPLLYGEGSKAFLRLQEEIIRNTDDTTFLCWGLNDSSSRLLSSSPAEYSESAAVNHDSDSYLHQFNLTNLGLEISARIFRWGWGTYGMFVAETQYQGFVLVLRKRDSHPGRFYRAGLSLVNKHQGGGSMAMPVNRWERERKVIMLRGTKEQGPEGRMLGWGGPEPSKHGFDILTEVTLPITPVKLIYYDGWYEEEEQWPAKKGSTQLSCLFAYPSQRSAARMTLQANQSLDISIDLSFDFDCRPCALIYTEKPDRPVADISDSIPESINLDHPGQRQRNYRMTKVQNEEGSPYFFIRSEARAMFPVLARVPEELAPGSDQVWLGLVPPQRRGSKIQSWAFIVAGSESSIQGRLIDERIRHSHMSDSTPQYLDSSSSSARDSMTSSDGAESS